MFLMWIQMLRDQSNHDEVDDEQKPGNVAWYDKEMLVGECVTDVLYTWNVETR